MDCRVLTLSLLVLSSLAVIAGGQQPKEGAAAVVSSPAARKMLLDAFGRSKVAKTADDITPIIELCEKALADQLTPANKIYGEQLLSWAYNRRGELFAEQAATFFEQGRERKANEFDALALSEFEAAIKFDATKWKPFHNRGVSLALHGRLDDALIDFNRVLEMSPDYANAWFNRGELMFEKRRYADAAADYSQALKRKPDDAMSLAGRGSAYLESGKLREALADLDRAVALDANQFAARVRRGDARQSAKQWDAAAEDYRQAIKQAAQYAPAYRGAAWLMATCPEERYRNPDLALRTAQKAVELTGSHDYEALEALAAAQANAGEFEAAVKSVEQALALAPEDRKDVVNERKEIYAANKPYRQ